jgi:diguanylate cyclase (GGDEF)-like protein
MAEGRRKLSDVAAAHRAEREAALYVWAFRLVGILLGLWGLAFVLLRHAHTPADYALDTLAFTIPLFAGIGLAALGRRKAVDLERSLRGQLAARAIQLQDLAMRDELTQLVNRRYFYQRFQQELDEAHTLENSLGIVLLDVDGLKGINDTFGHKVGDEVLAALGRLLAEHTRSCDIPARVGGDEFAVLMLEADERGLAVAVKRLQDTLEGATVYEAGKMSLKLRLSWGTAGYPWAGTQVDDIMRAADSELYATKATRRRSSSTVGSGVES